MRKRGGPEDLRSADWDTVSGLELETDVWPSLMRGRDVAVVARLVAGNDSKNVALASGPEEPPMGEYESPNRPVFSFSL